MVATINALDGFSGRSRFIAEKAIALDRLVRMDNGEDRRNNRSNPDENHAGQTVDKSADTRRCGCFRTGERASMQTMLATDQL